MLKVENLKSSSLSPVFEECTKEIKNVKDNLLKVELLEQNADYYIYEYFEDIKRQVDIRREDLKFKIDNYSYDIIESVETNKKTLIDLSKDVNKITENINKSRKDLNELIAQFETLETDEKKFEDIKASVAVVNQEFHKILAEYQDNLLDDRSYTFEFEESRIENIFGRVIVWKLSSIVMIFFNLNNFYLFPFKC